MAGRAKRAGTRAGREGAAAPSPNSLDGMHLGGSPQALPFLQETRKAARERRLGSREMVPRAN
jgi:hypothetical protein